MEIKKAIFKVIFEWLINTQDHMLKSELRVFNNASEFSKLPLPDKILVIGKTISRLPLNDRHLRSLEKTLVVLNRKLNLQIIKTWSEVYSRKEN